MTALNFDEALRRLLVHEGGYTNHPSDPGGPTNFGITIGDYRRHVKPDASAADVRAIAVADAKAIYRRHYWNALRCDDLPAGVDYAVFDYGVNSGIGRAGKVLRRALGLSDKTHVVDDSVLRAVAGREAAQLVAAICDERLAFLKRLRTWPVFGAGWGRRVSEVRTAAIAMARSQGNTRPGADPVRRHARQAGTAAIVVAGAAAAQQAHQSGTRPWLAIAILVVTAALAAAVFWRLRLRRKSSGTLT